MLETSLGTSFGSTYGRVVVTPYRTVQLDIYSVPYHPSSILQTQYECARQSNGGPDLRPLSTLIWPEKGL